MSLLKEYASAIRESGKKALGKYDDLYEYYYQLGEENRKWQRNETLQKIRGLYKTLMEIHSMSKDDIDFARSDKDTIKVRFNGWINEKGISHPYAVSLTVLVYWLMKDYSNFDFASLKRCFEDFPDEEAGEEGVLIDLVGMMLLVLEERNDRFEEKKDAIYEWIRKEKEAIRIPDFENNKKIKESDLENRKKSYYQKLWDENNEIEFRDYDGGISLQAIREEINIANLYVLPSFTQNNNSVKPIKKTRPFNRFFISDSGGGKSTFLKALVSSLVYDNIDLRDKERRIYKSIKESFGADTDQVFFPVLVKANDYNEKEAESIKTLAVSAEEEEKYTELLNNNKENVLLLIDALDELKAIKQDPFGKMIDNFLEDYPDTSVLITTRKTDMQPYRDFNFNKNIDSVFLNSFGEKEIKQLIEKWTCTDVSLSKENTEEKYAFFAGNRFLQEIIKNPYMLTLALFYNAHGKDNAKSILSGIIDKLIEKRWDSRKYKNEYGLITSDIRRLLSWLAWKEVKEGGHGIDARRLPELFNSAAEETHLITQSGSTLNLNSWEDIVNDMSVRSGLLILENGSYVFQNEVLKNILASERVESELIEAYDIDLWTKRSIYPLKGENKRDAVVMAFSLLDEKGRKDENKKLYLSLLHRTAESLDKEEIREIGLLFADLLTNSYGPNLVSKKRDYRGQIIRFLYLNRHLFLDKWKEISENESIKTELSDLLEKEVLNNG